MSSRAGIFGSGLLFVLMFTNAIAFAQESERSLSLAERLGQMRRGWFSRNESQPQQREAARSTERSSREPRVASRAPTGQSSTKRSAPAPNTGSFPQVDASGLFPSRLTGARRPAPRQEASRIYQREPAEETPTTNTRRTLPRRAGSNLGRRAADQDTISQQLAEAYADSTAEIPLIEADRATESVKKLVDEVAATTAPARKPRNEAPTDTEQARQSPEPRSRDQFDPADLQPAAPRIARADRATRSQEQPDPPEAARTAPPADDQVPAPTQPQLPIPQLPIPPQTVAPHTVPSQQAGESARGPALTNLGPIPDREEAVHSSDRFTPAAPATGTENTIRTESRGYANSGARSVQSAGEQAFGAEQPTVDSASKSAESERQQVFRNENTLENPDDGNVLAVNRTPMISSHVSGPRQILVGREATYTLRLTNRSDVPADEIVAEIDIPTWADVVDTTASTGIIQRAHDGQNPNTLRWQMHRLNGQGSESLELKLIPRTSRPLEIGMTWTYAPVDARAVVEVQEPKLRMHVSGPDEVAYGKAQVYRLTLTNPGTGLAEKVEITLLPPGGGEDSISSHLLGDLPAGTSRSVEVELTPREAGKLFVKASASAEGGLKADAAKEIFCRKPELEVDWRGPDTKYAGTMATYFFRVRNPGTATAEEVVVHVDLPDGLEFVSASENRLFSPEDGGVSLRVGALRPGDDYYMELKCQLEKAGNTELTVRATTSDGEINDSDVAHTTVIALADLKLEVGDPTGPIPVGEDAVYEIRVRNRGTNVANEINIVALFSEGIEPQTVEGAQYNVTDGRVSFRSIDALPAGREVVLRIRARANRPGTHVFRAEVLCRDLDIKLAAEETTRFFQDEIGGSNGGSGGNGSATQAAGRAEAFEAR